MRQTTILALAMAAPIAAWPAAADDELALVNTLDSSAEELEAFFASLQAVSAPDSVEVLTVAMSGTGLIARPAVGEPPVALDEAAARELTDTLLRVDSYRASMSACLFQPAVAFRFHSAAGTVEVPVCFECNELIFREPEGKPLSGRFLLGKGRAPLLAIAKKAFPGNAKLQALSE